MRLGMSCAVLKPRSFGVDNMLLGLLNGLLNSSTTDTIVLFTPESLDLGLAQTRCSPMLEQRVWPRQTRHRVCRVIWEQLALPVEARRARVDVLHAPSYIAPVLASVPTVVSVHDVLSVVSPELCKPLNRWHHRALLARSVGRARAIVTPSFAVSQQVRSIFGVSKDKVHVVPPGIDERFTMRLSADELGRVRQRYDLPRRFLLWAGNLEPKKNIPRLLEAARVAHAGGLDIPLVMTGSTGWGTVRPSSFTSRHIRWLDYVSTDDLAALYQMATVFLFPSLSEGFGLPVIEALASGTPVIASAIPAALEVGAGAVELVDAHDVHAIARSILRVASDPAYRRALSTRGQRATSGMSWRRHAGALLSVYRRALAA